MERSFPYISQQRERGCVYFKTDNDYESRREELERTVIVLANGCHNRFGMVSITVVIDYLKRMYGGENGDYPCWNVSTNAYMIQLPHTLVRNRVIERGTIWGQTDGWHFYAWEEWEIAYTHRTPYMVKIKVTNFPRELWLEEAVEKVISEFGEECYVDEADLRGMNRSAIHVWFKCVDPYLIPFSSTILFDGKWKECYFQIMQWYSTGWTPPGIKKGDGGDHEEGGGDRARQQEGEDIRSSLLRAHDGYLEHRKQLVAQSDSNSSSPATDEGMVDHDGPGKENKGRDGPPEPSLRKEALVEPKKQLRQQDKGRYGKGNWSTCVNPEQKVSVSVGDFSIIQQVSFTIIIGQVSITQYLSYTDQINSFITQSHNTNTKEGDACSDEKKEGQEHARGSSQEAQQETREKRAQIRKAITSAFTPKPKYPQSP